MWHLTNFSVLLNHIRNVSFLIQRPTVQTMNIQDQEKKVSNIRKLREECPRKMI